LEDTVIIKEVHALHILEYNNLCNHLKDDDDVTRSTISHQGKNTPCQTFIMDGNNINVVINIYVVIVTQLT
jgi:hypothetical protein